jgi:hypothetical protein
MGENRLASAISLHTVSNMAYTGPGRFVPIHRPAEDPPFHPLRKGASPFRRSVCGCLASVMPGRLPDPSRRTTEPYEMLKSTLYDGRLRGPTHPKCPNKRLARLRTLTRTNEDRLPSRRRSKGLRTPYTVWRSQSCTSEKLDSSIRLGRKLNANEAL